MKTFELLSIIGSIAAVGIALGAIVIGSIANLHTELRADIRAVEVRLSAVENRLSAVEQRQARTEGLVQGLRNAINAHNHQEPSLPSDAG